MTNRKGLLESITTGYIKSYISFTENPKMLEKDKPSPVKSSGIKVKQ